MAETVLGPVIRSSLFKGIFGTSATPIPAFSPIDLFSTGSQGIWLDPSDLSTMFSDRAGTTPVTTPGTVVGLRLDKSKGLALGAELVVNGTFATDTDWTKGTGWTIIGGEAVSTAAANSIRIHQHTATTYPAAVVVEIRYTITSLSSGAFAPVLTSGIGGSIVTNGLTSSAPGTYTQYIVSTGTFTGWGIRTVGVTTGTIDNISVREIAGNHAVAPTDAARPVYGIEPKGGRRNLLLATDTLATQSLTVTAVAHTLAFTGTGTVTLSGASIAGPLIGTGAGNRVSLTFTPTAASLTLTVVGSVTLGQLELGSSATAYQKVVTAYNVTEAGVATCHYVQFDGSDDSLSTSAISFALTNKMSVFAGVRKLSDAATGAVASLSTNPAGSSGVFEFFAPLTAAAFDFRSRGTVNATASSVFAAPVSGVATGLGDISGDLATLRINGSQVAQVTTDQGTGNYGNYPLFFGRRNNATLPFNGKDYGIIVVGKAASAGEITDTETWLAARTAQVTI